MATDFNVHQALTTLVEHKGSDLHLKVPSPPLMRISDGLVPIEGAAALCPEDTETALHALLHDVNKLDEFTKENEVDFACAISGLSRFRVNAFRQRGSISLVCRAVPFGVRTLEELNLPPVVRELAEEPRGIVLVTGSTGSGKSTTLAAMVNHINETLSRHIVTIEDPIEFLHTDKKSLINQREVGLDTASFSTALRRLLRQDPDVILLGELRDEETVRTALSAAETGHLVFSTLHTADAPESINRIIDFFPGSHQQQARSMLAGTLRGIISQRLIPGVNPRDRVAVCEILRTTGRVSDMIHDPKLTPQLPAALAEGAYYGMQTFDQALLAHLQAGRITLDDAMNAASNPHDFKLLVSTEGRISTSMDDIAVLVDEQQQEQRSAPSLLQGFGSSN